MKIYEINKKKFKFNPVLKIKNMKIFAELSAKLGDTEGKSEIELIGNIEIVVKLLTLFCVSMDETTDKEKIEGFLNDLEMSDIEELTKIFTEIMEEVSKKK